MTFLFAALIAAAAPQTAAAPTPAPAPAPAAAATTAAKFTLDTPIETIMADPKGKAVLTADMGGTDLSTHPMYESFKSMSLNQVAPMSQGKITDDLLKKLGADLAAVK